VRSVKDSIRFYSSLGLKLIVHSHDRYARFELPEGNATLSLHQADSVATGNGIWVYFECADLEEKVAELEAQGIRLEHSIEEKSWLWTEAHLLDPDGNKLILYRAGENRKNPPWRLND
jgi:catechol 2,3-dioxygenase-like lactoylglutathione lyase family enzyme